MAETNGVAADITSLGDKIATLTLKDAVALKDYLKDKYKIEPESYAAYGYEAARVVLDAISRVGRADRTAIRDAILATRDFDGVLGRWSFDQNGDTTGRVYGVFGPPTVYFVDRQGRLVGRAVGAKDWESEPMRRLVESLVQSPERR